MERLRAFPWVDRVQTDAGGRITVSVTDPDVASRELLGIVVAAGVRLVAFERARPSLEDVFLRLVGGGRLMRGLSVLTRKELLESWRTLRIPIVGGLFLIVGLSSPLLAKFLPEIIEAAAGDQLPAIPIPTPVMADAADSAVEEPRPVRGVRRHHPCDGRRVGRAGSRDGGVRPVEVRDSRGAFLAAKAIAIAMVLGAATLLAVILGWFYTAVLFEPPAFARLARVRGAGLAGAVRLGRHHVPRRHGHRVHGGRGGDRFRGAPRAVDPVRDPERRSQIGPGGLAGPALALATGAPVTAGDVLTPVLSTVALIVAALAIAAWSFRRREL